MPLTPSTRLGVYIIEAPIGAGGMGEVYRARDARLNRDVAIKILPEQFAMDHERLARFKREAQVLASLNHTNIAAIYGFEESGGIQALVLELVDGPTLADRIARGPIPLDEALTIARQIAEAVAAAHEQGIIHRDLKPANVKLRPDGTVKVLDFGLAKVLDPGSSEGAERTVSPTITSPAMTRMGVILGTAAYMSPEQAKGRVANKRSDMWAFGCLLYEMLTGKRAFEGEDMSDTLATVLKSDPDWSLMPTEVPAPVVIFLKGCLVKDPRQRVSDMSTAKFVLSEFRGIETARFAASAGPGSRLRKTLPFAMTALLTALIVGAIAWALRPASPQRTVAQFAFTPAGQSLSGTPQQVVAISPDGTRLAYTADGKIYVRSLAELQPRAVTDTETLLALNPVFAPDGESIVFVTMSEGGPALKRVPFSGGTPSTLATLEGIPSFSGISWSRDGILVGAAGGTARGILRIGATGGAPERIVSVETGEIAHGPQMLPDGHTVLFTLGKVGGGDYLWDKAQIVAQSLRDGARRVLIEGGSDARYVQSGHLVYAVGGTIYAAPFDPRTLTVTGAAVPVISGIRRATGGVSATAQLAVSDTGTLVYVPGPFSFTRTLVLGDGHGDPTTLRVPPAVYVHPRVSPDGRILAVARTEGSSSDVWTYDLSGKAEIKRLTFGGDSRFPVWSADNRRITYQSRRDGAIWWQGADGGIAERLTSPAQGEEHVPESWSRDGRHLLFSIHKGSVFSLWVFTLEGRKAERFGKVESAESLSASFSPDGRWVAYALTEKAGGVLSPNRGVFVEPYPSTGERHQAPKRLLDYHPLWAPDGKSIFYVAGANKPLVSVPVTTRPSINFATPVELPRAPMPGLLSVDVRGYDVLPDGRFVSVSPGSGVGPVGLATVEIRVVLNWFEELKRLVPTK